jgi:integrase
MILNELAQTILESKDIRRKTYNNYTGALRRNILPTYGFRQVNSLSKFEFAQTLSKLPPQTSYQTLMALRSIFRSATEQGFIDISPVDGLKPPKIMVSESKFMTWDFMLTQNFGRYDTQIRFLALHGLRWGEAVVLKQSDIYEGFVHITKSIHGAPKSHTSNRKVPYLGSFSPLPKSRNSLAKSLAPHNVNIHSLRKTYAYILKRNGIHVTTAQKLLGHASPMITLKIYTSVLQEEIGEAGDILKSKLNL